MVSVPMQEPERRAVDYDSSTDRGEATTEASADRKSRADDAYGMSCAFQRLSCSAEMMCREVLCGC